jgi:hypothetical protein
LRRFALSALPRLTHDYPQSAPKLSNGGQEKANISIVPQHQYQSHTLSQFGLDNSERANGGIASTQVAEARLALPLVLILSSNVDGRTHDPKTYCQADAGGHI